MANKKGLASLDVIILNGDHAMAKGYGLTTEQAAKLVADTLPVRTIASLTKSERIEDLRRTGDMLQSEASRLAEWALTHNHTMPYEVMMAAMSIQHAVQDWTEIRRKAGKTP